MRLRILKQGKWVATPFKGPLEPGARKVEWDGAKRVGRLLDGTYDAVVEATDAFATTTVAVPFSADTRQPKIRIVQRYPLRLWVSEPARLTLRFGTRSLVYEALAAGEAARAERAQARHRPRGRLGRGRELQHPGLEALTTPPGRKLGPCNRRAFDRVQSGRTCGPMRRSSTRG